MRLQHMINSIHLEKVFLVSSTILFAPDSDTILVESLPELDRVAQQLKNNDYNIRIDGHTARVGSTRPVTGNETTKRRAENRRVEFVIVD